jgi:hypothetical protein
MYGTNIEHIYACHYCLLSCPNLEEYIAVRMWGIDLEGTAAPERQTVPRAGAIQCNHRSRAQYANGVTGRRKASPMPRVACTY